MGFSPYLPRKRPSHGLGVRLQWAFPPACRGRGRFMDLVCACDGLFSLLVEEKAFSWTRRECSRWTFPPACQGKGRLMDFSPCLSKKRPSHGLGGNACDGLSPLPVKEKAVSWTWCALAGGFPRRPGRPPEVPGENSRGQNMQFLLTHVVLK